MNFFGVSIFGWIGFLLLILILFQFLSGRKILKVNFTYHRIVGQIAVAVAVIKTILAVVVRLL